MDNLIQHISTERYLSIDIPGKINKIEIPLSGVNFITGYNDVGKTYILKSIYAVLHCLEFTIEFQNSKGRELGMITSLEQIRDKNLINYYKKHKDKTWSIGLLIQHYILSTISSYNRIIIKSILGVDKYSFIITDKCKKTGKWVKTEFAIDGGSFSLPDESINFAFMSSSKTLEYSNILLGMPSNSSIKGLNNPMAVPDYDKDLIEKLNKVYIDFLEHTPLKFDDEGNCEIQHNNEYVKISEVGDGLKVTAVIDTLINNRTICDDSVLLLDEPDNGLHTKIYNDVLQKIYSAETVFLTTHNATFINASTLINKPTRYYYCEETDGIIDLKEVTAYEASRVLNTVLIEDDGIY